MPIKYTHTSAVVDGPYRYRLKRAWEGGDSRRVMFIMLNPSTADGTEDDATIRKIVRFSQSWGYSGLTVCNLFAFRATRPPEMNEACRTGTHVVGPENLDYIWGALHTVDTVICAWGNHIWPVKVDGIDVAVLELIEKYGHVPQCLELTQSGRPFHPLYLPGETNPQQYPWRKLIK